MAVRVRALDDLDTVGGEPFEQRPYRCRAGQPEAEVQELGQGSAPAPHRVRGGTEAGGVADGHRAAPVPPGG
ncbi:hypothetical protein CUT44_17070 [Streptomyces carminius]|uniref:Uncharacterized protein n=1 Tax=Streptomyces carminius TaxID=2665496 RepID=A0A2M8LXN8_9ACTN|nr:hypothetical protein CUT44_17070 [Streptomyces carminius]